MNIQQKLDSQLNEVLELFNKNLMDACLSRINRIIKSNKKQFLPYNYRGIIFLSLGKNAEALDDFKKALALNSSFPEGYNNLALAYRALKKPELALLAYKKSLALNPNSIEARMNLATLYAELNLFMQSIEEYKLVIKTNPSHEHAYQLLADILLKIQKYDDAISYHKKACELNPQNFMNYYFIVNPIMGSQGLKILILKILFLSKPRIFLKGNGFHLRNKST
jgi:tetratricopeptide (TPR) repeat protein